MHFVINRPYMHFVLTDHDADGCVNVMLEIMFTMRQIRVVASGSASGVIVLKSSSPQSSKSIISFTGLTGRVGGRESQVSTKGK